MPSVHGQYVWTVPDTTATYYVDIKASIVPPVSFIFKKHLTFYSLLMKTSFMDDIRNLAYRSTMVISQDYSLVKRKLFRSSSQ